MLQIILTIVIYLIMVIPAGLYLYHIAAGKHTPADPVFDRLDNAVYKLSGIKPRQEMNWRQYAAALVCTNAVMLLLGYMVLRLQSVPLLNPNGIDGMEPSLACTPAFSSTSPR